VQRAYGNGGRLTFAHLLREFRDAGNAYDEMDPNGEKKAA
jgi:hypothetical protein